MIPPPLIRSALTLLALATSASAQIVINEINYDPADKTKPLEFIELYNAGAQPVDVSGWRLEDGITFVFSNGTSIPAGGYFVVAENAAAFQTAFGVAPGGVFTGSLSNEGERVQLRNAGVALMDEVTYGVGFPWPTASKSGGSSMELIHPSLDNDLGGSWRASTSTPGAVFVPRGASGWRYRETRSDPPATWKTLGFDDSSPAATEWAAATLPAGFVGTTPFSPPVTFGTTVGFGGNAADKTRTYYFRKKFTVADPAQVSSLAVNLRRDDAAVVWVNNDPSPTVISADGAFAPPFTYAGLGPNATNTSSYISHPIPASKLVAGENIIAIELHQSSITSSDLLLDAELLVPAPANGTPGGGNSVFAATAPPQIRQVTHTPERPAAGEAVTITTKVTDPQGVASVSLEYQLVDPGAYIRRTDATYATNWTSVPMLDDGLNGDAVAADATFSVTLPANLQTHRRLVRYRITVADVPGASIRVPYADDEQPNFAYFVYTGVPAWTGALRPTAFNGFPATAPQTFPTTLLDSIPPYHLLANAQNVTDSQYNSAFNDVEFLGTMVFEGVVYDHIQFKNRGIGSTYVSGKNKWAFLFNRARDFQPRDNWGRRTEPWNSFGMDANAAPWASVHRGSAGVEEALSYRIYELAGVPALRTHYIHFRVIDAAAEAGPTQYDGDLWGLYLALEPMEGNFIDARSLPDGNIYSIEGNQGDKKHQGATQPLDSSDWNTFRDAVTAAGQTEAFYRANEDLPNLYTFLGVSRLIGNVDVRPADNYRYYHRPTDNRWLIMPYDLDMQFIAAHHWGGGMDGGMIVAGAPNTIRAVTRHAALAVEFRNRCRELLSLMASDASPAGGQIGQLIDEYAQLVNPAGVELTWSDLDAAMWNLHPRTSGGGANTGQSSHKGNFWRALYNDGTRGGLGGTIQTATWIRQLPDPDANNFSDHEGMMQWFVNFSTNTYPAGAPTWLRKAVTTGGGNDPSTDRQKGYGYKYLEWESQYGGFANATANPATAPDLSHPNAPTIAYAGPAGFPANSLDFTSGAFSPSATGGTTFAAMQWRIGEIRAPGVVGYTAGNPRKYEIEEVWTSPELAVFSPNVRVPVAFVEPGQTYRARVRHKDTNGRWSLWSPPVQFVAAAPDVTVYQQSLVVSEVMYHPAPVTPAEFAAGYENSDFEYLEVRNVSGAPVDLTDVRFTKGIDFDFAPGFTLAAGAGVLVVKNVAAFNLRYGAGKPIAGAFIDGNLRDSGEEVKLSYGVGTPIREFTYRDLPPWPTGADGDGFSLVRRSPENLALDDNLASTWRASAAVGGSPGGDDRTSYTAWATANGVSNPLGDGEGDGLTGLAEYALAADPHIASPEALPVAEVQTLTVGETSGSYFTLSFRRLTAAEDVSYHVEFSPDLAAWTIPAVRVSTVASADGTSLEVWRSQDPLTAGAQLFSRLRVVKP